MYDITVAAGGFAATVIVTVFVVLMYMDMRSIRDIQDTFFETRERVLITGPEVTETTVLDSVSAVSSIEATSTYLEAKLEITAQGERKGTIEFIYNDGSEKLVILSGQMTDVVEVFKIPRYQGGPMTCRYNKQDSDTQQFTASLALIVDYRNGTTGKYV